MTEKRFIIAICGDGKIGIRDLTTSNEYTSERQVADYMNRITDENEQLKQQLSEQGTQIDFLKDENKHMRKVLEENKKLKQDLQQIQDSLWTTEHIKKLEKENKELKQKVNFYKYFQKDARELEKESEQLKSEIKGMRELLKSYRKTIKHDAELLADATKNGYLPPLGEWKEV